MRSRGAGYRSFRGQARTIRATATHPARAAAIPTPMIQPRVADSGKGDVAASMTARSQQSSAILQGPERAWLVSHNFGCARFTGRFSCAIPGTPRSRANDLNEIACAPRLGHKRDVARHLVPAHIPGGEDDPEIGPEAARHLGQLGAAHARHAHISEQDLDLGMSLEDRQRTMTIVGVEHLTAAGQKR